MILTSVAALRWFSSLFAVALLSYWKGGAPERLAVLGIAAASVLTTIARAGTPVVWGFLGIGVFLSNALTLGVTAYVMMRSNRWWPIGSVACQAASVIIVAISTVEPRVMSWAYSSASIAFDYLNLLVLSVGILLEGQSGRGRESTSVDA